MKHTQIKQNELKRSIRGLAIFLVPMVVIILGITVPELWANDDEEIPFDEAHLFFELNNTDGDLGIHALIDGDAWKRLMIEDTNERKMLDVEVTGRLRRQGLTEIFFESAEPTFDELPPTKFFQRFPAGIYEIEGRTLEGEELENEVLLTHVMPAPVDDITLNCVPVNLETIDCDDENTVPIVEGPSVIIRWEEVTMSHPDANGGGAGVQPPVPVNIVNYEVVIEVETEAGFSSTTSVILPPNKTSFTVPAEVIALGDEFKYEILAREATYNQTAVESCFVLD